MQEPKFTEYCYPKFPKRWGYHVFGPDHPRVNITHIAGGCFENVRPGNCEGHHFSFRVPPEQPTAHTGTHRPEPGPEPKPSQRTNTSPIEIQMKKIYRSMLFDKNLGGENLFNRRRSEDKDGGPHGGGHAHTHTAGPRMTATADFTDKGGPRVTATFAAGYTSPPRFNTNRHRTPSPLNHPPADKPKEPNPKFTTIFDIRSTPTQTLNRENGLMDHGNTDQERAMNLSTNSSLEMHSPTPNGDHASENGDVHSSMQNGSAIKTKRKSKTMTDFPHQPPLLLMQQQHGLIPQPMQQLLQQHIPSPQQLQQAMQQSAFLQQSGHQKLHEQLIQHMNEQLQLNIVQQSQLMQQAATDKKQNSKQIQTQLQQLAIQQQQLVQQMQLQQRQYLLSHGLGLPQFGMHQGMNPLELQQLWKEVASQSGTDESAVKNNVTNGFSIGGPSLLPSLNGMMDGSYMMPGLLGQSGSIQLLKTDSASTQNTLYGHGVCKWPGCDTPCDDYADFMKHMNNEHTLDDRSTAQARVQMQVVSQLEIQLNKERERLQAMMHHLHMKPHNQEQPKQDNHMPPSPVIPPQKPRERERERERERDRERDERPVSPPSPVNLVKPIISSASQPMLMSSMPSTPTSSPPEPRDPTNSLPSSNSMAGPIRRRVSDKCNLPISAEIQRNRDFYKSTDVRPPFTYASLIRQAIIESPNRQLTLNEIYQWFTTTFAYFRRNEATWKNAVRHNLSLHKCFMRVENVKGAVWTVDEVEFYKRRPQKMSGYDLEFDVLGFRHRMQMKSPSMTQSPQLYGESLNASLRAALAESGNVSLLSNQNSSMQEEVEDLSLNKYNSSMNSSNEDSTDYGYWTAKDSECVDEWMNVCDNLVLNLKQELNADEQLMHLAERTRQESGSHHDMENDLEKYREGSLDLKYKDDLEKYKNDLERFKDEEMQDEESHEQTGSDEERSPAGSYGQLSPRYEQSLGLYNNFSAEDSGRPLALTTAS
ncbi:forkhead box protein P1-B-like isoform X3 [Lineus longissimus]|uniref:forkhead box protein P1-B-like isoform X3 n=1 Tax=Lineus longissimus TaxID=88925 RepID=UPI00315D4AA1